MENSPTGDRVKGNWMQFKGKIKEKWGKMTDDELDVLQGRREQLIGKLQERTGEDRARLEKEVERYASETGYRFG